MRSNTRWEGRLKWHTSNEQGKVEPVGLDLIALTVQSSFL